MKLQRDFIAVENPFYNADNKIILTDKQKQDFLTQKIEESESLKVMAIGDKVTSVMVGDRVFIDTRIIASGQRIHQKQFIFLREGDIIYVY